MTVLPGHIPSSYPIIPSTQKTDHGHTSVEPFRLVLSLVDSLVLSTTYFCHVTSASICIEKGSQRY